MKKLNLIIILLLVAHVSMAQKKIINLPDIPGYVTLKCDLHIHTVFSDGQVWPTYRVDEAWKDGLDALAIADHLEYQPKSNYIPADHNAAWNIARNLAAERNLILIHSTEITRSMPPGHLNALFVNDASIIMQDSAELTIENAVMQGAFIQWNHPGWKAQEPDGIPKLYDRHKALLAKGMIHGIEFFNDSEYYPNILEWCNEYDLAAIASSDIHGIISESYPTGNRPMTLVFAKERSEGSIKEALMEARTVAYFNNILAGPEYLLRALFETSISVSKPFRENEQYYWVEITNRSDVPFFLTEGGPGVPSSFTIEANSISVLRIAKTLEPGNKWKAINLMTGTSEVLEVELKY
ncbi:MAG TPA: hypothetical protein VMW76_02690 [Bacteroidales bacterium]|nr:hypothetical protein [Bacteroidales bacterium]